MEELTTEKIKFLVEQIKKVHGREHKHFYENGIDKNDLMAYEIEIDDYKLRIRDHQDSVRFQILEGENLI